MNRIISKIISLPGTFVHTFLLPLFAFVFTLYYRPTDVYELLNMKTASFSFNSTIMLCIMFVSVSITRWTLLLIGKYRRLTSIHYICWCIGETMFMSLFCALYLVLMSGESSAFFETAGMTFLNLATMVIYPYAFTWLCFERNIINNETSAPADENSLIRFYDEYKKLRLVIAHEAVMFIKSEDNYVQIHYVDRNMTKKFMLRSSMRALEDDLSKKGLVRCHRSYFINPLYIKIVHKDEAGLIVAELKQDGFESIPISRKYQDAITKLL